MALNSLYRITFKNSANSGFVNGDVVITYWDDVAESIVTKKNGVTITSGVGLGLAQVRPPRQSTVINYVVTNEPADSVYQVCSGTTLLSFKFVSIFPYTQTIEQENSASCITNIVCDLQFQGAPIIVNPTTESATDGQVTVLATGSNGTTRYSLDDVLYSVMTNTTGVFTGLGEGSFIVYARDQYNCSKSITVILEAADVYGVKYRLEYTDLMGIETRIDILERDFAGDLEIITGTNSPITLSLRGENQDIFTPILASEASIGLTSITNFQFLDLFTQDDRKYQVRYYKDESGFQEYWRGYITPGLYTEQYVDDVNYYVNAEATDQLQILKNTPFNDASGNVITGDVSLIKIIAIILSNTDLELNIRSCVSIFDVDMDDAASDDPLAQTYVNAQTYSKSSTEPFNCNDTLSNILFAFGARILQWKGYWYIIPIDFYANAITSDSITYREFDTKGDYVGNGSFTSIVGIKFPTETNRACWRDRSQNLEVRQAYGSSEITYNLQKVDFGVKNGGFESFSTELESPNAVNGLNPRGGPKTRITNYDNWTLNLNGNSAGLPFVFNAFGNTGAKQSNNQFYEQNNLYSGAILSNSNNTTYANDAYLQSTPQEIIFSESDWIRVSFDFFAGPIGNTTVTESQMSPPFVKFRFSFKLDDYYLRADGGWTTDSDFEWIEVNVERGSFGSWKTIDIKAQCPPLPETVTTYRWKLMHGSSSGNTWDFTSSANLQALPTVELQVGYIAFVALPDAIGTIYRWYRLEASTDSTSDPDRLRPTDYNGTTNKVVWMLFDEYSTQEFGQKSVKIRNFDNVTVELLPQGQISPDEHLSTNVNNTRIKEKYEAEIFNGDAPGDVTNSKNTYFNYFKYEDGTPTSSWNRYGVDEGLSIIDLLSKRIIEQHTIPRFKLTGNLTSDVFFGFFNSFLEDYTGKYYIPMGMSIEDKSRTYTVEIQEVLGLTTTGGGGVGEFDSEEFDNSFDI